MSSTPDGPPSPPPATPVAAARPAALLAVRITPTDVGSRVSVRHRLHDDTTASLTDVVGILRSWDLAPDGTGSLVVERRDGTRRTVPLSDVVAAKVVPPPRPAGTRRTG